MGTSMGKQAEWEWRGDTGKPSGVQQLMVLPVLTETEKRNRMSNGLLKKKIGLNAAIKH